ncbi:MAG: hypothetical protein ABIK65_14180 [Candidatus Eisenbacteria bacterium]
MSEERWKRELRELLLLISGGDNLRNYMKTGAEDIDFDIDEETDLRLARDGIWEPATRRGRRWFRSEERAVFAPGVERFLIESVEMGLVTPHLMERFLDRLGGEDPGSVDLGDAREILISLFRADGRDRCISTARDLGPDMTLQ